MSVHGMEKIGINNPGNFQIFRILSIAHSICVPSEVLAICLGQILKVSIGPLKKDAEIAGVQNVSSQMNKGTIKVYLREITARLTPCTNRTC